MLEKHTHHYLLFKSYKVFKKQRASEVPIHLQDKIRRLIDIFEQYETISPVNKEQKPKRKTKINHITIQAKRESFKIVLNAGY